MARTALIVGAAASLGLGVLDLTYLNVQLVPRVLDARPVQAEALTVGPAPAELPEASARPTPPEADVPRPPPAATSRAPASTNERSRSAATAGPAEPPALAGDAPHDAVGEETTRAPAARVPPPVVLRFASGDDLLPPSAPSQLARIARVLVERDDLSVAIAGHADERGSNAYNDALSERRAQRVAAYLSERGVPSARMSVRGYGERRPVTSGRDRASLRQNRRVEVVLQKGQP